CDTAVSQYSAENAGDSLHQLPLAGLIRSMAENHMPYLVSHDSRQLRFVVGGLDGSAIDVYRTAGQSKCIDRLVIHDFERERKLVFVRRFSYELLTESRNVVNRLPIVHERKLPLRVLRGFPAEFDVLFDAEIVQTGFQSGALSEDRHRKENQGKN